MNDTTQARPTLLTREAEGATFQVSMDGFLISLSCGQQMALDPGEALALADFLRAPGVRPLLGRAWLAYQVDIERQIEAEIEAEEVALLAKQNQNERKAA